jgi:DNA repair exonuclease SbcCD ATPase subunit
LKIKQIMLKNFANVNQVEINLSDSITYLIGENGSGKTTVGLNSVWFILEGLALKGQNVLHGERFRFIGEYGPSAVGQLTLHDEVENIDITITRKLLKNKTELKITASDKRQLPDNFIDDIFNLFSINPVGFAKLSPQEQSVALGIDTTEFDKSKKIAYDERTELGRDVKRLASVVEEIGHVDPVDPVDLKQLLADKKKIDDANSKAIEAARDERDKAVKVAIKHNQAQDEKQAAMTAVTHEIEKTEKEINTIQDNINRLKIQLGKQMNEHDARIKERSELPTPDDKKSTDIPINLPKTESTAALTEQIESAEEINKQAALYQQFLTAQQKHDIALVLHGSKQAEMDQIESDRVKYIKSCNIPFSNITIDDAGGVLIDGRPFSETYFSKGEILRIGIKLAASTDPKLKYIFVPDSQSIDEKNREKLFTELVEAGFQVVAEYVDTEKQKDHGSILLKESRIVESYHKDEDDLSLL